MPPGINLLIYSCFAVTIFLVRNINLHLIMASGVTLLLFFIPFRKVRSGFLPIMLFISFTFISNLFYQSGRVIYVLGSLTITAEGLRLAAIRMLRVFDMVYAAKILTAATPMEDMINSLRKISRPLERIGVPVHEFFTIMALTLKCFPVLKQRLYQGYKEMLNGSQEKTENYSGVKFPGYKIVFNFRTTMKMIASFLIPLFIESMTEPEKFFEEVKND
ncbi:MAG: hypothetical protein HY099_06665 [Nitrospirae bacterium]|nr:hypothetical protein [Nitrospirota bacterium]